MYKVAVVGDKDSVLAFKALGVKVFTPITAEEIRKTINNLAKDGYGVIYITEQLAKKIPETIGRYNDEIVPSIILIPNSSGTLNIGMSRITENVEKAVGSNIL